MYDFCELGEAIRWSTYAPSEKDTVLHVLKEQLQAHEFLATTEYKVFHDLLSA